MRFTVELISVQVALKNKGGDEMTKRKKVVKQGREMNLVGLHKGMHLSTQDCHQIQRQSHLTEMYETLTRGNQR